MRPSNITGGFAKSQPLEVSGHLAGVRAALVTRRCAPSSPKREKTKKVSKEVLKHGALLHV